jgi:hypothetical protein
LVVEEFTSVTVHDCQGPMYLCVDRLHAFGYLIGYLWQGRHEVWLWPLCVSEYCEQELSQGQQRAQLVCVVLLWWPGVA